MSDPTFCILWVLFNQRFPNGWISNGFLALVCWLVMRVSEIIEQHYGWLS